MAHKEIEHRMREGGVKGKRTLYLSCGLGGSKEIVFFYIFLLPWSRNLLRK